jgi:EmrB/QacA subfamily drug resistance transporter
VNTASSSLTASAEGDPVPPLDLDRRSREAPPAARPWFVLAVAAIATGFVWVDATALNLAFPALEHSFAGVSRSSLSWVLNAYNILFAALLVPAGRLADILGPKRPFLAGLALFTIASAACAAAPSPAALIACRLVQAAGAAGMLPAGLALVLAAFSPARLPGAMGVWSAAGSVAAAVGPVLGGSVIAAGSWRWIFLINVPVGIAAFAIARLRLTDTPPRSRRLPDFLGTLALALGVTSLALAVVEGRDWGWGSPRILTALVLFPLLIGAAVLRSRRHEAPALDLPLLRQRQAAAANGGTMLFGAAIFGGSLANVLFLTTVWHYSELQAALGVTAPPLMSAIAAGPAGRLVGRIGPRAVAAAGLALFAAGMGWLLLGAGRSPEFFTAWLPGTVLFGAGIGVAFPAFAVTAVRSAPPSGFGLASSLNTASRQVGAVLGVAVVVAVLGAPAPDHALAAFRYAWMVVIGTTIVAAMVALTLRPPDSPPAPLPSRSD